MVNAFLLYFLNVLVMCFAPTTLLGETLLLFTFVAYLYYDNKLKSLMSLRSFKLSEMVIWCMVASLISLAATMLTWQFGFGVDAQYDDLPVLFLTSCVVAPMAEEMLFRVIIYKEIKNAFAAALITSILFAVVHWPFALMAYAFLMSMLLCYVYKRSNCFLYVLAMHIVANATTIFINFFGGRN